MRKLRLRGEMTCPRSHSLVSGGISGRITSPATYSSASSGEVVGSSLVLRLKWSLQLCGQRHFREREMKCPPLPEQWRHPHADAASHTRGSDWSSLRHLQADMKPDEPCHVLWGQFTRHRLGVKCLFSEHPSSRVPHSNQPKKQALFQALGVTSPRMTLKPKSLGFNAIVALAVAFCTTVKLFQS